MNILRCMLIPTAMMVGILAAHSASAQSGATFGCKPGALEQSSREAKTGNPEAVRTMVNQALECSAFAGSADSLRDRVFRAELAYRAGKQKPVTSKTLAAANNTLVTITFSPQSLKTTEEQIRLFRVLAKIAAPDFVGTDKVMSPAEAVFISGSLARQKFFDPNYTLDPGQVATIVALAHNPSAQHRSFIYASLRTAPLQNIQAAFREQIPHEWSVVTSCMHLFLDLAGLPR